MRVNERMKKVLSILLCLCMVAQYVPTTTFAVETDGLCAHHTELTAECGYVAAVDGMPRGHVHTENCGYVEAAAEVPCSCEATDEYGAVVHTEDCAMLRPWRGETAPMSMTNFAVM